jgi:peptide/nickel transport system permease protein
MIALGVFVLILVACLLAPFYAHAIARENPFTSNITGTIHLNGKTVNVIQQNTTGYGTTPIGPTWHFNRYFLGADTQGRDIFARLLYGGRATLYIGSASAAICVFVAAISGIAAGYFGGAVDWVVSRVFDIIWAFPVYLLAISLSVILETDGLNIGFVHVQQGSLTIPILIISVVFIPYVGRPLRGIVLTLKEREFIHAAIGSGASDLHILRKEILPNVAPTIIVFFPLMIAFNMLTESALSFLGIGVQAPQASWGTIVQDGLTLLYTRPLVALMPGIMLVLTAGALNVLGDGLRDAFDPKAKLRGSI